jgi:hypothetical protein
MSPEGTQNLIFMFTYGFLTLYLSQNLCLGFIINLVGLVGQIKRDEGEMALSL